MFNMYEFVEVDKAKETIKQDLISVGVPEAYISELVDKELIKIENILREEDGEDYDPYDIYNQRYIRPYDVYLFNELF